jgi:macrolide transport system ATP-binding/permease protein
MHGIWPDLRYGVRQLVQQRAFTVVLGLGIGANTTVFSVANAFLLRPLPVSEPARLLSVFASHVGGHPYDVVSFPDYRDLRERSAAFSGLAAQFFSPMSLRHQGGAKVVMGQIVSWNFFDVLGVRPALGRTFQPEEDRTEGAHPVAILSHRLWTQRYGSSAEVLGQTIFINDRPFTVIGVAPEGFTGLLTIMAPDVWVPTMMVGQAFPYPVNLEGRGDPWLTLVGRLNPGVSLAQARDELDRVAADLAREHPDDNTGKGFTAVEVNQTRVIPNETTASVKQLTGLLLAVVALVLLVACFNVANLCLARAAGRQREIALRASLGASRWRIVRQLLIESSVLSLLAGGVGLLIAVWTTDLLSSQRLSSEFPLEVDLGLDGRVVAFAVVLSLATSLVFGLVPALQSLRYGQYAALRDQSGAVGHGRGGLRVQRGLVVGQIAVSMVLLVSAGLFLEGLGNALDVDPGFSLRHGLIVPVNLGYGHYTGAEGQSFFRDLKDRARSLPGVESVAWAASLPLLSETQGHHDVQIDGYEPRPDEHMLFKRNMVDADYLDTMGTRVVRGRGFTRLDQADTQPVVIVNETTARRFWPDGDALGGVLRADHGVARVVVGVVQDGKYRSLGEEPQPYLFIPMSQADYVQRRFLVIRTAGEPGGLSPVLEREIQALDPALPVSIGTVAEARDKALGGARGPAMALSLFGLLALGLAMVGVYGVVSYAASRRTHEFGVRMALGARGREIVRLVLRHTIATALIGIGVGLALALAATRLLRGFLFGADPLDPVVFAIVAVALAGTALGAASIPARRAARLDPMQVLRWE